MPNKNITINALFTEDKLVTGDANGDGKVSIGDVVVTVNYVLEKPVSNFVYEAANVDGDTEIDMADVVQIVNIVLGRSSNAKSTRMNTSAVTAGMLTFGTATQEANKLIIPINLSNAYDMSAVQMDLNLPNGTNIENIQVDNAHVASWNKLSNGYVRLMIYSVDNNIFANNNIANITMSINGATNTYESISYMNIIECTPSASKFMCDNVSMDLSIVTTISSVNDEFKIHSEGRQIVIDSPSANSIKIVSSNGIARTYRISAGRNVISVNSAGIFIVNNQKIVIK